MKSTVSKNPWINRFGALKNAVLKFLSARGTFNKERKL